MSLTYYVALPSRWIRDVMYDVSKLRTPQECRTVLQRAREQNLSEVYNAVFRRLAKHKRSWSTFRSGRMDMAKKSWLIERLESEGYNFDPKSMTEKHKSKKKKVKKKKVTRKKRR